MPKPFYIFCGAMTIVGVAAIIVGLTTNKGTTPVGVVCIIMFVGAALVAKKMG